MKRKIFSILLAFCICLMIFPATVFALPGDYDPAQIAIINGFIANNNLTSMTPAPADGSDVPADWAGKVTWHVPVTGNGWVIELILDNEGMTGALDVSGLYGLESFNCSDNNLTSLRADGLSVLTILGCSNNKLTELSLTNLPALEELHCYFNYISGILDLSSLPALRKLRCHDNHLDGITLNGTASYQYIDCSLNFMPDTNAVTGKAIVWDDWNFQFGPQNYRISFNANGGSGFMMDMPVLPGDAMVLPDNEFTPPAGKQFKAWAIGSEAGTQANPSDSYTPTTHTTLYAVWEDAFYPITVNNGTANPVSATMGTTVTITANAAPDKHRFKGWTVNSANAVLSDAGAASATFTMPDGAVEITAEYELIPTTSVPKTGDNMNIYIWSGLPVFAAAGLALLLRRKTSK